MATRSQGSRPFKRNDGRWSSKYYDVDGRPRYVYGRTRNEVKEKLRQRLERRDDGVSGDRTTVGGWLEFWLDEVEEQLRPSTVQDYRYRIGLLPEWILKVRLDELEPLQVQQALREIERTPTANGRPRAASTVAKVRTLLGAALELAERWGRVRRNAARLTTPPRVEQPEIEPLTIEEAQALLGELEGHRFLSLYMTLMMLGLRRSELLGLRWSDVDLEEGTLRIRQTLVRGEDGGWVLREVTKTAKSRRTVALPSILVDELQAWRPQAKRERLAAGSGWHDHGLVWPSTVGTPVSPRNLTRQLHGLCEAARIRRVGLHTLRHSAATIMLAQGVPERVILEILGHSTMAMMVRYQHVVAALKRDAADAMDRAFRPGREAL